MRTSIVMAVHGNWPVVERAVAALEPQLGPERELLLVDDASPQPPPAQLSARVLLRNEENLGFGPSCNRGAAAAQGRFLCFLNSDSLAEPGALEALEAAAERRDTAVAGVLLNEDRSVQEAGSSVGRDGVSYPLGRGSDPSDPVWSFTREVDFASAACLLVRREWFEELGGFDDRYAPGYYEDADLCLRLAEGGRPTVVEPAAKVVHLQYGSGSRERATALVRRNRATFLERHSDRFFHRPVVVAAHPWPHRELALRDAIALIRFLVFEDRALAGELAERRPGSRVTLAGDGNAPDGVESADPDDVEGWLEDRRFHYTAVLGAKGQLGDALRRSQPQAARDLDDPLIPPPGEEPRG